MDYSTIIPYFVTVAALAAAPGPLMAMLVVRALGRDTGGAAAFAAGLCAGDMLAMCAVALGIGVWAQDRPELLSVFKYLGVAYLLWVAVGMWNSRPGAQATQPPKASLIGSACAGLAVCVGNPSTLLIFVVLLPGAAPGGVESVAQIALLVLVTFVASGLVFFGTILLARQAARLIATPAASNTFSRIASGTIALTSVWILAA